MSKKADDLMRFEMRANVLKALAHPVRLMLVDALRGGERCVCELVEVVASERTSTSKHLAILKQAGLLRDRKEGLKVFYSLACPCVLEFFDCVEGVLRSNLETQQAALASQNSHPSAKDAKGSEERFELRG